MKHDSTPQSILVIPTLGDIQRFWSHVSFSSDCWNWTGHTCRNYGAIRIGNQRLKVHRVSWLIHFGQIPQGLVICHHCDTPTCVRPDHLFMGTVADNHNDMKRKGRGVTGDRNGMRTHPETLQGEKHGNAKLTDEAVQIIRKEYVHVRTGQRNPTRNALAKRFGVNPETVRCVATNTSWRHIDIDD